MWRNFLQRVQLSNKKTHHHLWEDVVLWICKVWSRSILVIWCFLFFSTVVFLDLLKVYVIILHISYSNPFYFSINQSSWFQCEIIIYETWLKFSIYNFDWSFSDVKDEIRSTSKEFVEFLKAFKRPASKDIKERSKEYDFFLAMYFCTIMI